MAIVLQKGQKVDLTKGNKGLKKVLIGLGWDVNKYDGRADFDLDSAAFCCAGDGKVKSETDFVFYNNLRHPSGAVMHLGDNLTRVGDGDDEQIYVNLKTMPSNIHRLVFVVNIYDANIKKQHFGMVKNAFIRLVYTDKKTEICRFNLSDNYDGMTGLVVGEIYRHNGQWKFNAIGRSVKEASRITTFVNMFS